MPLFKEISQYIDDVQGYIIKEKDHCAKQLLKIYGINCSNNPGDFEILMISDDMKRNNLKIEIRDRSFENITEVVLIKNDTDLFKYEIKIIYDKNGVKVATNLIKDDIK
jgi:hypothetical protein